MTKKSFPKIEICPDNSSVQKMLKAINESPTQKAIEAFRNSAAHQEALAVFKTMGPAFLSVISKLEILSRQTEFATIKHSILDDPSWLRMQAVTPGVREKMMAISHGGHISENLRKLLAGRLISGNLFEAASASLSSIARANQWAPSLANIPFDKLQKLYPRLAETAGLNEIFQKARTISAASDSIAMSTALGLANTFNVELEGTRLKLSAFVGATNLYGLDASTTTAAYHNVFGGWRTRPDLPQRFWREPAFRQRMYEEAEVDAGLVDAELCTSLEVVVESGLAGGFRAASGSVAIIEVGSVTMSIRSQDPRNDAYRALGIFEQQLRAFVESKLRETAGPKWFKQRVDGTIGGNAKVVRESAVKRGEAAESLIHYTDLGDLNTIVLMRNNWNEIFERVFINRDQFNHDMQKLVANRRPVAHSRTLDSVQLVEIICVVNRLTKRMHDDGAWKSVIQSDE